MENNNISVILNSTHHQTYVYYTNYRSTIFLPRD